MMMPVVSFFLAFGIAAAIGPSVIQFLRKVKFGQKILEIGPKWHMKKQNIPTMGGFIFIFAIVIAVLVTTPFIGARGASAFIIVLCMALAYAAIGFLDDYRKVKKKQNLGLSALQKLLLQIAVAIVFITVMRYFGFVSSRLVIPFTGIVWELPWIVYNIFMAFVIVGTVNAVNITDGLDGLAAGVTLPVAVFYTFASFYMFGRFAETGTAMLYVSILSAALSGALIGFLLYNFYPAKVFMGDTGSLFLGAMVCGLAFAMDLPVIIIPIGIIYIIETLSDIIQVTYFKCSGGKRVFKMAPIHHHFEMCGYSERQIVLTAFFITAVMCILSYFGVTGLYK